MLAWLCLGQGADLHMTQLMPLPLIISCSSKFTLVLPSWFYLSGACSVLTRVVPDKIQEDCNGCVCVCMWLQFSYVLQVVHISSFYQHCQSEYLLALIL